LFKLKIVNRDAKKRNWLLTLWLIAIAISGCREPGYITPPPVVSLISSLNTKTAEIQPHFSHDGHYLVFSSDRQRTRKVFLYDVRNRRLLPLPGLNQQESMQYQPDLSADGRYIVYVSEQFSKPDILLYDRVTREIQNLTRNFLGEVRNPTISGNGRFIAFESNRSGQWDIEIYDRGLDTQLSLPIDKQKSN
jgi:Tol biopolymer transport system component